MLFFKHSTTLVLILAASWIVVIRWPDTDAGLSSIEQYCGFSHQNIAPKPETNIIELQIWARGYRETCWRTFGPVMAANHITDYNIQVGARSLAMNSTAYYKLLQQASVTESVPDIMSAEADWAEFRQWADSGYLEPLDECRRQYHEFDHIAKPLWNDVSWRGITWGVPFEVDIFLLFYNKTKLRELGWTEQQIALLPKKIQHGEFTVNDMISVARQAIEVGVIPPGFGYWPAINKRLSFLLNYAAYKGNLFNTEQEKLTINQSVLNNVYTLHHRLISERITLETVVQKNVDTMINQILWDDAVAHGRVLFFSSANYDWATWAEEHLADRGGKIHLSNTIGYALYPSGISKQPGHVLWSSTGFYVITSEKISGRQHQDMACRLLAQTVTPKINAIHAETSAYMGVLISQTRPSEFTDTTFNNATNYMQNYLWYPPRQHEHYETFMNILVGFLEKVEHGELPPIVAAGRAIQQIQNDLSDVLVVE